MLASISMFLGFVQVYLASIGKWQEKLVGIFENLMTATVCFFAALYGTVIFTVCVIIPLSIFGIINWKKHQQDDQVELNKMTFKKSLIVIFIILSSTALVSFLLTLIPNQNLPIFDAAGNILNVCGIVLLALRYKEGWIIWLLCNSIELVTWILALTNDYSQNAIMMIIKCVIYIMLNVWGFVSFIRLRKNQEIVRENESKQENCEILEN